MAIAADPQRTVLACRDHPSAADRAAPLRLEVREIPFFDLGAIDEAGLETGSRSSPPLSHARFTVLEFFQPVAKHSAPCRSPQAGRGEGLISAALGVGAARVRTAL
jgi:hypothetical protein